MNIAKIILADSVYTAREAVEEDHSPADLESANAEADRMLVIGAACAMADKLKTARDKGRGGWWSKECCSLDYLRVMLKKHVEKGDMVDVMNLAAMIYAIECTLEKEFDSM